MLNFDRNNLKLFGKGKNCPEIQGKILPSNICKKMWHLWTKNMKGVTAKDENLHRSQSDPALEKTPSNFFDANISEIFSFTKTTEPHNIQLVPNI